MSFQCNIRAVKSSAYSRLARPSLQHGADGILLACELVVTVPAAERPPQLLALSLYDAASELGIRLREDNSDGDPDKEGHLYILQHTKCPAVLTENLFQDNREDVDFLLSAAGKASIVELHVRGIAKYLGV